MDYWQFMPGMALFGAFIGFAIAAGVLFYVYFAMAWMKIAEKLGHRRAWLAWIPIANIAMILQLGRFHWAWVFLLLIPFLGWAAVGILSLIAIWRVYEKRKYPGWLALLPIGGSLPLIGFLFHLASLIVLGLVAWKDR